MDIIQIAFNQLLGVQQAVGDAAKETWLRGLGLALPHGAAWDNDFRRHLLDLLSGESA
jgi:hypothetical protein